MDQTLKYRIVGAAVLLSLAVIFIPMILDGSGKESVATIDMKMPPEPTLVFSDELEQRVKTPAPEHTAENKQTEPVKTEDTQTDIKQNIVPEVVVSSDIKPELLSWVVQVGAFGEREKAVALQEKLKQAGYDVFVVVGEIKSKDYFRVKVGPVISQDEATKLQEGLVKKHKLSTAFVTRYPRSGE